MRIGTMFRDILGSFFTKSTTRLYPVERVTPPERYRGILSYNASVCTGCSLCVKDCPSDAIELVIIDRAAKKYVMKYHMDRCIYCAQCVASCPEDALTMSSTLYHLASTSKPSFTEVYTAKFKGNDAAAVDY